MNEHRHLFDTKGWCRGCGGQGVIARPSHPAIARIRALIERGWPRRSEDEINAEGRAS